MDRSLTALRVLETDRLVVEAELARLLEEKRFSGAPQMSSFLNYIVTQTLDGKGDRIKAYTVGVDALGKPHTFDAQSDPSVRVLALRLRKTLAAVYESDDRCHARIVLKVGTYVPEFLQAESVSAGVAHEPALLSTRPHETSNLDGSKSTVTTRLMTDSVSNDTSGTNVNAVLSVSAGPARSAPSSGETVRSESMIADWLPGKPVLLSVLFILMCFWILSEARHPTYLQKLSAGIPLSTGILEKSAPAVADAVSTVPQDIPTLYLVDDVRHSQRLRQVSMLLGSSVVQSGSLNVVQVSPSKVPFVPAQGDYHMMLNELYVESKARIDGQILRLPTGTVVTSFTLMFDNTTKGFSIEEVKQVEGLANQLTDVSGSLFKDFCILQDAAISAGCRVEQFADPSLLSGESDAV
ncbi:MAG: hypothetical protein AB8B87_11190 [Granulosicoccus sp.]